MLFRQLSSSCRNILAKEMRRDVIQIIKVSEVHAVHRRGALTAHPQSLRDNMKAARQLQRQGEVEGRDPVRRGTPEVTDQTPKRKKAN